jgi:hypothetical protein
VLAGSGKVRAGNRDGGRVLAKPHAGFGCGDMQVFFDNFFGRWSFLAFHSGGLMCQKFHNIQGTLM